MKIVYTDKPTSDADGVKFIDPKFFNVPIKEAREVYYDGDNLNIIYGYETLGIFIKPLSDFPKSSPKAKSRKGE